MEFVLGLVIGAGITVLAFWLQASKIIVKWYEWLLASIGFVLGVWAINDFLGSMSEHNERAGRVLLALLGIPAVVLLALAIFLVVWRYYKARKPLKTTADSKA
jgi:hypothetical protein